MMGLSGGSLTAVVAGSVFGFLFLVACIVSAAKAVRDRRVIRERQKAKRRARGASSSNGHAPRAGDSDASGSSGGRRARPNILIIHDGAREERVKRGTSCDSTGSSPRLPLSGPSSASPGEGGSRHTDTTTVAEVACHHSDTMDRIESGGGGSPHNQRLSSGNSRSPGAFAEDSHCAKVKVVGDNRADDVDIAGETVTYKSSSQQGAACSSFSSFSSSANSLSPSRRGTHGEDDDGEIKPSRRTHAERAGRGEGKKTRNSPKHRKQEEKDRDERRSPSHSKRKSRDTPSGSPSRGGFAKNASKSPSRPSSRPQYHAESKQDYSRRRNSYAPAIDNTDWVEVPPVRRHSDEPIRRARHAQNMQESMLWPRPHERRGKDNPAYDGMD